MSQPSLIRFHEVQKRTGYSKAWLYRLMSQGKFPSSIKIGSRSIAFVESEVDDWINQRIEDSRKEVA
ncbi:helix-turn-helix transcriptional regulator [Enterobacter bugandensis]|jgi:prophage regulatory protein